MEETLIKLVDFPSVGSLISSHKTGRHTLAEDSSFSLVSE